MRFLHCSDVHITQDYSHLTPFELGWRRTIAQLELRLGGRSVKFANAAATLAQIGKDAEQVDHFILSGDLTAYSMESEFAGARAALEPILKQKGRCTVIPGNHDRYTPRALSTHRFEKYFGELIHSDLPEYLAEDGFPFVHLLGEHEAVVGLCSARVPRLPGLSYGVIGKAQLTALGKIIKDPRLDGRAVLVVVHHAPFREDGTPDKPSHGLVDREALLSLLPGTRFAVLHGHIHHRFWHQATDTRPHIFGAGSSTQLGREGYWVIETKDGRIAGATRYTPGGLVPPVASAPSQA